LKVPETTAITDGTETAAGSDTLRVPEVDTPTYASLTYHAAVLRDRAEAVKNDAMTLHREAQTRLVDERTALVALQDPIQLLADLADRAGLSWTAIGRMVGVTDAAIRKWRRGETIGSENRRRLARAVAFLEILAGFPVGDVATWLEMRLSEDATITPLDLYMEGRLDLLFDFVSRRASAHHVLDAFDSNWRHGYAQDATFSVVRAPDGELAIIEQ
jgi:hypothetical protein